MRVAASFFPQEKKECQQKLAKEQGALREQLQVSRQCGVPMCLGSASFLLLSTQHSLTFPPKVHIQTIGILVSEKSELQTALAHTQQAARQKAGGNLGASLSFTLTPWHA